MRLENGNTIGIIDKIDNDKAYVIFGQFRTECDLTGLVVVEAAVAEAAVVAAGRKIKN